MALALRYKTSVLGEDPERGGAQSKVWLFHTESGLSREDGAAILTDLKKALSGIGYSVIQGSSSGSYLRDNSGERTLESSFGGTCLSMLFTHKDSDLPDEKFLEDVRTSLNENGALGAILVRSESQHHAPRQ